ncbi:prophage P2a protein 43 [Lactiplantibacillus plantarum]|nr:phage tail protein [Lactiplantibacillus plantarum]VDH11700.1 prophage P2a protein 43 [Lactiplantibacillus plantarum]
MANNYDKIPVVTFSIDVDYFNQLFETARGLARNGMPEAMEEANKEYRRAVALSKAFIKNAGAREQEAAQGLERTQVGHGKSGYEPTGTLQGSIEIKISDDGKSVSIMPMATVADQKQALAAIAGSGSKKPITSQDGITYYGVYVEFGTDHNKEFGTYRMAPEPFMKPTGEKVATRLNNEFERIMRLAVLGSD